MLEPINQQNQVIDIYNDLSNENNWYWWIDGGVPSYEYFENWVKGCDEDPIGIFINSTVIKNERVTYGFSRFSRTSFLHGTSYLTIWIKNTFRKKQGLISFGTMAAFDALFFTFNNFPLRKIYYHVITDNIDSLSPLSRLAHKEGELENYYFIQGEYRNVTIMSIDRNKWNEIFHKYKKRLMYK